MSFIVYPAIDVLEGRCVRLAEGRREHVTIEGGDLSLEEHSKRLDLIISGK